MAEKHQVVIVVSGAVAVGPPLPSSGTTDEGPLFAVMPLSRRRQVTFGNEAGCNISNYSGVHFPVIFTNLKSEGREPDDEYVVKQQKFGIWYPLRERMQVTIDGKYDPGKLTYEHNNDFGKPGQPGHPDHPSSKPIEDFAAVPDMRILSPKRRKLRAGVLDPLARDVAAQLFVPSGTLKAGSHDDRKFGHVVAYGPADGKPSHRRAVVVPQVRITIEVERRLTIRTWSLDADETDGTGDTGRELDPLSFVVDKNAEIWIGNLDPDEVLRIIEDIGVLQARFKVIRFFIDRLTRHLTGSAMHVRDTAVEHCDVDFARLYELTDGSGDVVVPCDVESGRGERKCYTVAVAKDNT